MIDQARAAIDAGAEFLVTHTSTPGAGAVAVGVGGWLTSHDDLAVVTERARQVVSQVV